MPETLAPDELTVEKALELLSAPQRRHGRSAPIPATGLAGVREAGPLRPLRAARRGRRTTEKPQKTQSLLKTMKPETVTLDAGARSCSRCRARSGMAPDGDEVRACTASSAPTSPWARRAATWAARTRRCCSPSRSRRRWRSSRSPSSSAAAGTPKPPLATFGEDPVSGKEMVLKEGQFGLYVTDGETNASLRRGDDPADLTPERAAELLAERREYMASPEGQQKAALRTARRGGRGARVARAARAPKASRGRRRRRRPRRRRPRRRRRRRRRRRQRAPRRKRSGLRGAAGCALRQKPARRRKLRLAISEGRV